MCVTRGEEDNEHVAGEESADKMQEAKEADRVREGMQEGTAKQTKEEREKREAMERKNKDKQERRRRALDMSICNKCGKPSKFALRKLDAYCQDCFLASFMRKVRMDIGKHRLIKQKEQIMLAYSGGNRSSSLLAFVREMMECKKRPFRVDPLVVFIDERSVLPSPLQKHLPTHAALRSFVEHYGFKLHVYALEDVFASGLATAEVEREHATTPQLSATFAALKTPNAKEEMLRILRHDLLHRIAVELGIEKVMLGDCATQLAMHCLTLITRGRGASITQLTDFATQRDSVYFLKPFRFLSSKEIALYSVAQDVRVLGRTCFTTNTGFNASYERLTEHFIAGLEAEFPSTTTAVLRTAQKLTPEATDEDTKQCVLCGADIEARDAHTLANHHKDIGVRTSTGSSCCGSQCGNSGDATGACSPQAQEKHMLKLVTFVCYGCRNLLQQADSSKLELPHIQPRVAQRMSRFVPLIHRLLVAIVLLALLPLSPTSLPVVNTMLQCRDRMKDEIKDFLLSDDDDDDDDDNPARNSA